ncbi:hypothetical protein GCM10010872_33020 [Dyella flava]|nr:hypothetical protein GCM10010872_33020 [Dyella flava]
MVRRRFEASVLHDEMAKKCEKQMIDEHLVRRHLRVHGVEQTLTYLEDDGIFNQLATLPCQVVDGWNIQNFRELNECIVRNVEIEKMERSINMNDWIQL